MMINCNYGQIILELKVPVTHQSYSINFRSIVTAFQEKLWTFSNTENGRKTDTTVCFTGVK